MPKQVDSIFDLLESYDCDEITLRRQGPVKVSGHLQPEYVLTLVCQGIDREWRDHALPRLLATAVVDITASKPGPSPEVAFVVPYGADR